MRRCRERGFSFTASMVICRESAGCIRESVNLLASLGCQGLKIGNASPQGEWANESEHYLTQEETWQAFLDYVRALPPAEDEKPVKRTARKKTP